MAQIIKNKIKNSVYLDRDSDAEEVAIRLLGGTKRTLVEFLKTEIEKLQEKNTSFRTLNLSIYCENEEMQKLQYFYRSAVVPYYYRQSHDFWNLKISMEELEKASEEIKNNTGFILYNSSGVSSGKTNSTTTFANTVEFTRWLEIVARVCFDDMGYFFPISEEFNELVEKKGRAIAQSQSLLELQNKIKNMYEQKQ